MPCAAVHAICNTCKCLLIKGLQKNRTNSFGCIRTFSPQAAPAALCSAALPPVASSQITGALPPAHVHGSLSNARVFLAPTHHRQSPIRPPTQAGWPCAFATRSAWSGVFLRMPFCVFSPLLLGHPGRQKKETEVTQDKQWVRSLHPAPPRPVYRGEKPVGKTRFAVLSSVSAP